MRNPTALKNRPANAGVATNVRPGSRRNLFAVARGGLLVAALIGYAPARAANAVPPIEDPHVRAALPPFTEIPASRLEDLTPANGWPAIDDYRKWHRSMGGPTNNRFSPLTQINRDNVHQLQVAWTYHSGDGMGGSVQCNPIIVDGVMFAPTSGMHIVALDAATGRELWRFAPEVISRKTGDNPDKPARRGMLFWPGTQVAPPRVLFTCGKWIYALNPKTGLPISSFGENGRAYLPTEGTVGGAVYQGIYVVPGFRSDIYGYDIATGKELWRFRTRPEPGEFGAETWKTRINLAGANCWGGMALDESRGIAYFSTGSPKPNLNGPIHLGDNLFANCVIALDAKTGKRLWHFQGIRHDIWDLDFAAPPNLVTVTHRGKKVDAVSQLGKDGLALLLDRVTGQPLFPVRMRRVPTSKVPGEETAPYQPDPELPERVMRMEFRPEDITDRTPAARDFVTQRVAGAAMGFFLPVEYAKPVLYYGINGGVEWSGAAFDPRSGRLYVTVNRVPYSVQFTAYDDPPPLVPATAGELAYRQYCITCHGAEREGLGGAPPLRGLRQWMNDKEVTAMIAKGRGAMLPIPLPESERQPLLDFLMARDRGLPANKLKTKGQYSLPFSGFRRFNDQDGYPASKPPWGTLDCLDLNTGKILWRIPLGDYEELKRAGVPRTGTQSLGGATATAGNVLFVGGTEDSKFWAFDIETGKELWSYQLPTYGTAPSTTYEVNGRQHVVVGATGNTHIGGPPSDVWVAFALPESARR